MNFKKYGFEPEILSGIKMCGYESPTEIQQKSIKPILKGKDLLGLAHTGTGKTAAFALPILQKMYEADTPKKGPIKALVLAPTRELALQINESFINLGSQTGIRSTVAFGGVGYTGQAKLVAKVSILVACPGRLLDMIGRGDVDLSNLEYLVLDEADRMLDMGFLPDVRKIVKNLPTKRQNLLFSATMPADMEKLVGDILNDPEEVRVANTVSPEGIEHFKCPVPVHLKQDLLKSILTQTSYEKALVFVRTKRWAQRLALRLQKAGLKAVDLHGDLSQSRRVKALEGYKAGEYDIMVATDIAARGIDCSDITHVFNYDLPDSAEVYTHRSGRTGRAGRKGQSYTLMTKEDISPVKRIEKSIGEFIVYHQDGFDYKVKPTKQFKLSLAKAQEHKKESKHRKGRKFSKAKTDFDHDDIYTDNSDDKFRRNSKRKNSPKSKFKKTDGKSESRFSKGKSKFKKGESQFEKGDSKYKKSESKYKKDESKYKKGESKYKRNESKYKKSESKGIRKDSSKNDSSFKDKRESTARKKKKTTRFPKTTSASSGTGGYLKKKKK